MKSYDVIGYAYHASLYCDACGESLPDTDPDGNGKAPVFADSETDSPNHCESCEALIPEALTSDGVEYVTEAIREILSTRGRGYSRPEIVREWSESFDLDRPGERLGRILRDHYPRIARNHDLFLASKGVRP